jgi:hypothetical protein
VKEKNPPEWADFSIKIKKFEVLIELFQKFAGQGQRPCRPPQRAKLSFALQTGAALGDRLEGVKSPLMGDFCSFTSARIFAYGKSRICLGG